MPLLLAQAPHIKNVPRPPKLKSELLTELEKTPPLELMTRVVLEHRECNSAIEPLVAERFKGLEPTASQCRMVWGAFQRRRWWQRLYRVAQCKIFI